MSILEAVILGLVQGLAEFLPISSSGHLVIMKHYLGLGEIPLAFDVLLHIGTLMAVFYVFWRDILNLITSFFGLIKDLFSRKTISVSFFESPYKKFVYLIIIGAIPTALIGVFFADFFERLFTSIYTVGIALWVTGLLLMIADRVATGRKGIQEMSTLDALIIGLIQGFAITPGISRSGSTIFAGLLRGLSRETAAKYSFLLSVPVILGAGILEGKDLLDPSMNTGVDFVPAAAGFVVAAISGVFAIKILLKVLNTGKLKYFSYYVWILGTIIILDQVVM